MKFAWAEFDENTAAGMCYTSGTTGNPKGVVYSHRSNVLHAWMAATPDIAGHFGQGRGDAGRAAVSRQWLVTRLHRPLTGAAIVMPGAKLDGASVHELLEAEKVTLTAAVPTVWLMLLSHLGTVWRHALQPQRVVIGGSACPRAIHAEIPGDLWRGGGACLGHDGDVARSAPCAPMKP